jgi:hypothetical protein
MLRYYGLDPDKLRKMSVYQFYSYLYQIPIVENIFRGGKSKKPTSTKDLIDEAEKKGLKVPKR